ncbi:hypothetical protein [Nannocystis pusilla]|uniref:hypothetical protein n=1 Tax=Nannocystis pusilla TaxID=889268 RepID=UPI003BF0D618
MRPAPVYCRTRGDCMDQVEALLREHPGGALIGFDFPIGYPRAEDDRPVLPEGRALVETIAAQIVDRPDGTSNRFAVAAALNREIRQRTRRAQGPFWGVPAAQATADVTIKKPRETGVAEYRPVERMLRARKRNIQSAWKLLGAGSVGSQALLGLPAVARVLRLAGPRGRLWPFESVDREDVLVVAEIWPTLGDFLGSRYAGVAIKDARQVLAMRDAVLDEPERVRAELLAPPTEPTGWILGVPR